MAKRSISLLLAAVLAFALCAPAMASGEPAAPAIPGEDVPAAEPSPEIETTPEPEVVPEAEVTPEPEPAPETDATPEPEAAPEAGTEPESETAPEAGAAPGTEDAAEPAALKEGLVTESDGRTYYYENGQMRTGLVTAGGKLYYCSPSDGHVMKGGTKKVDGMIYYLSAKDGRVMKNGWIKGSGTKRYYADPGGALYTGLQTVDGKRYYFAPSDGHLMKGGWIKIGGEKTYYADKNGVVLYTTYLDAPEVTGAARTSTGVKVTWDRVSGAEKYRVYYKTVGGKWKKLADTASNSYTWTKAGNAAYAFTVRCVSADGAVLTSDYDEIGLGVTVPLRSLSRYSYFRTFMTDQQLAQAYSVAEEIMSPAVGASREDQLSWIAYALRMLFESGMDYSQSAPHYNDPYGYFVLGYASCAGCVRATGLCLDLLGISYEHVHENQWTHQWARVKVGSEYWICDAYGLYCGPEPGVREHPYL